MIVLKSLTIVLAAAASALAPASSAQTPPSASMEVEAALADGQSCVAHLAPLEAGETASQIVDFSCTSNGLARTDLQSAAAAEILLGVVYTGTSYTGSSLALFGVTPCTWGNQYLYSPLSATFNNSISSSRTYNGCSVTHYDGLGATGDQRTCTACTTMGTLDNRTSSLRYW